MDRGPARFFRTGHRPAGEGWPGGLNSQAARAVHCTGLAGAITVQPLPELPMNVRLMLEGLDLTLRASKDTRSVELVAERAYGFVFGIETVGALPHSVTDQLYRWVEAT